MNRLPLVVASLWMGVVACAPAVDDMSSASSAEVAANGDNGTELTATATAGAAACVDAQTASVPFTGSVSTTGSVDSVEISASVDGQSSVNVGTIEPQDFVHDGRNKTATYSVNVSVPEGTHQVQLCFEQSGSNGRPPKSTCAPAVTVTVACACSTTEAFGDLVGNPSLCKGKGPPHIPVHVKGDFGASAALTITGPGGYRLDATLDRAGDSCVYQYNWDTAGNGGAGTYAFAVSGANGHVYGFTAPLSCR